MEVFIEGGRSRDGRITLPRLGILSFVVDAFLDGHMAKARRLLPFKAVPAVIVSGIDSYAQSNTRRV